MYMTYDIVHHVSMISMLPFFLRPEKSSFRRVLFSLTPNYPSIPTLHPLHRFHRSAFFIIIIILAVHYMYFTIFHPFVHPIHSPVCVFPCCSSVSSVFFSHPFHSPLESVRVVVVDSWSITGKPQPAENSSRSRSRQKTTAWTAATDAIEIWLRRRARARAPECFAPRERSMMAAAIIEVCMVWYGMVWSSSCCRLLYVAPSVHVRAAMDVDIQRYVSLCRQLIYVP